MDTMLWEVLEKWKHLQDSNEQQANVHLMLLLRYALEKWSTTDQTNLDRLRYNLEQSIDGRKPVDWGSYNLGMARAINHMLQYGTTQKMKEYTIESLSSLEKKIIVYLALAPKSTPKQIAYKLEITNRQQISNLLRSMRSKELIAYSEIGRNRLYILTQTGHQAYQQIKNFEELAVMSSSSYEHLLGGLEIFKRKKRENKYDHKRDERFRIESSPLRRTDEFLQHGFGVSFQKLSVIKSDSPEKYKNRIAPYLIDIEHEGVAHE